MERQSTATPVAAASKPQTNPATRSAAADELRPATRRAIRLNATLLAGLVIIGSLIAIAGAAPWLAPADPARQQLLDAFSRPNPIYLLGADHVGRDILSRTIYGARTTLGAAALVVAISLALALGFGGIAGYAGGWIDGAIMRFVDLVLAFPGLIVAVAIAGTLGPGLLNITLALACIWWAGYARLIRGLVLAARTQEYALAARALGMRHHRILFNHILRNITGPLAVYVALDASAIVLSLAGLSFLGLGAQPPTPEWGAMLSDAQPYLQTDPHLLIAPGIAIILAALGLNLVGEGLRDLFDPYSRLR